MRLFIAACVAAPLLAGCCACKHRAGPAPAPAPPADGLEFRYRWVCESGHFKQTGPYKDTYEAAVKGAGVHEEADHEGQSTTTIETSMGR